jgi:hypothetical protein
MQIVEKPQAIVDVIFDCYERESVMPTQDERKEILGV